MTRRMPSVVVLRLEVVPLVPERVDRAGQRCDRRRHAVAEHAALDLDAAPRTPRRAPSRRGGARARPPARARSRRAPSRCRPTTRAAPASRTPDSRTGSRRGRRAGSRGARATGMPLSRITFLKRSLSIASADAATPAPTYATSASSRSPCTVPSSPNGPCRIGSTTSTAPSAASVPAAAGTGNVSAGPVEPRDTSVTGSGPGLAPASSSQRPSRPMATLTTS